MYFNLIQRFRFKLCLHRPRKPLFCIQNTGETQYTLYSVSVIKSIVWITLRFIIQFVVQII